MKNTLSALVVVALLTTSCSLLSPEGSPAAKFKSFEDTWTIALAAYDAHCDRVNLGKVDPAKEEFADAAWLQFRANFRAAFVAASRDWTAPITPEIETQTRALLSTFNE